MLYTIKDIRVCVSGMGTIIYQCVHAEVNDLGYKINSVRITLIRFRTPWLLTFESLTEIFSLLLSFIFSTQSIELPWDITILFSRLGLVA